MEKGLEVVGVWENSPGVTGRLIPLHSGICHHTDWLVGEICRWGWVKKGWPSSSLSLTRMVGRWEAQGKLGSSACVRRTNFLELLQSPRPKLSYLLCDLQSRFHFTASSAINIKSKLKMESWLMSEYGLQLSTCAGQQFSYVFLFLTWSLFSTSPHGVLRTWGRMEVDCRGLR